MVPAAYRVYTENVFVFGDYCEDEAQSEGHTERLLVNTRTVLHGLLQKHYETRQILSYTQCVY